MSEKPSEGSEAGAAKTALVTGGARRVGRALVLAFARAGMDVAFTWRSSEAEAVSLSREVEAAGRRALAVHCDLAEEAAPGRVFDAVAARFGRLDALVNNASTFVASPFGEVASARFDYDMAANARAPLMLIQAFAEMLGARYDPADPASAGRVVNFIDIHVLGEPLRGYASYNASKAALMEITATCALELAPRVTVNAIAPGVVEWAAKDDAATRREYLRRVPLGRPGTPADAAAAVLFLVREAHYSTGQILRLDGGRYLT